MLRSSKARTAIFALLLTGCIETAGVVNGLQGGMKLAALNFDFSNERAAMFRDRPTNVFQVKVNYWLGR